MRESRSYGSVRGAPSNGRPYRVRRPSLCDLRARCAAHPLRNLGQQRALLALGAKTMAILATNVGGALSHLGGLGALISFFLPVTRNDK